MSNEKTLIKRFQSLLTLFGKMQKKLISSLQMLFNLTIYKVNIFENFSTCSSSNPKEDPTFQSPSNKNQFFFLD
jgi:hypothetical protein